MVGDYITCQTLQVKCTIWNPAQTTAHKQLVKTQDQPPSVSVAVAAAATGLSHRTKTPAHPALGISNGKQMHQLPLSLDLCLSRSLCIYIYILLVLLA